MENGKYGFLYLLEGILWTWNAAGGACFGPNKENQHTALAKTCTLAHLCAPVVFFNPKIYSLCLRDLVVFFNPKSFLSCPLCLCGFL
jgi:hypothetical protein